MSALQAIWDPPLQPAATARQMKGWKIQVDMERAAHVARSRSPRRRCGVKAMLKSWAKGDSSAVGVWRLCHAIVTEDGTDAGRGMRRLAELGSTTSGSEQKLLEENERPTG